MKTHISHRIDKSSSQAIQMLNETIELINEQILGILIVNAESQIVNSNYEAAKLLGSTSEQLQKKYIAQYIPELVKRPLVLKGKPNEFFTFLSRVGHLFTITSINEQQHRCRLFFNSVIIAGEKHLCILIDPVLEDAVTH